MNKINLLILLIIFSISGFLNAQDYSSQTVETSNTEISPDTLKPDKLKSPTKAFMLSLVGGVTILPGLGQHYNGEHKKGFLLGAAWFSGMIVLYSTVSRDSETTGQIIGFPLVLGSLLWSCIDAPISAKRLNGQAQQKHGHMFEFTNELSFVGVDPSISKNRYGIVITVHF